MFSHKRDVNDSWLHGLPYIGITFVLNPLRFIILTGMHALMFCLIFQYCRLSVTYCWPSAVYHEPGSHWSNRDTMLLAWNHRIYSAMGSAKCDADSAFISNIMMEMLQD